MQIIKNPECRYSRSVVVLGMFDGVHMGHRVLIGQGKALA